jgi:hypothetical protein
MDDLDAASDITLTSHVNVNGGYRDATLCVHVPVENDPYGSSSHPVYFF